MTLLRYSAAGYAAIASDGSLAERLLEQMLHRMGRRPSPSEVLSWERSLPPLAQDLVDAGLGKVEVLLEYHLPLTSKRADVVLVGRHPRTGGLSVVVVELKQWSGARAWEDDPELVLIDGYPRDPRLHPVAQVQGYCGYLSDFVKALEDEVDAVAGVAYLHNAVNESAVADLYCLSPRRSGTVIHRGYPRRIHRIPEGAARSRDQRGAVRRHAEQLGRSPVQAVAGARRGRGAEPRTVRAACPAEASRTRSCFTRWNALAPGTVRPLSSSMGGRAAARASSPSRSWVSLRVGAGRSLHATGSRSFTRTLRKVAGQRAPRVQKLFKYFNQFMDAERNGLDVLILDEAHRIGRHRSTATRVRSYAVTEHNWTS